MNRIKNFTWKVDEERIFEILGCKRDSHIYNEVDALYQKNIEKISHIVQPIGVYRFAEATNPFRLKEIEKCQKVVLGLLTLGREIELEINDNFIQGKYLEGLLLDTIATEILFLCTEELYNILALEAKAKGWGLTRRFEPGSSDVPLHFQKEILANLDLEGLEITLNEKGMLNPLKTLTFFCGAGQSIKTDLVQGQACEQCERVDCLYKKDKVYL